MNASELEAVESSAWVARTVLVVDLVESCRLVEADQVDAIGRWVRLLERVKATILPAFGGKLVKSLGDGLLMEFADARHAVAAALAIRAACEASNEGVAADRRMLLRIGANLGKVLATEHDVYGHAVNLAARLASEARPGEILVSGDVRDQLTATLDADVEDVGDRTALSQVEELGQYFLKNIRGPVRAYRVGPPPSRDDAVPAALGELQPAVAVIPFEARGTDAAHAVLGEVLADDLIASLSGTADLRVISRLSTTAFRGRKTSLDEVATHLGAAYVVSGSFRVHGADVSLNVELAETKTGRNVWGKTFRGRVDTILAGEDAIAAELMAEVGAAIINREVGRAQSQALATLESYTLLIAAINLMHRMSREAFERSREMLDALAARLPRHALPHAWMAKWHVMRVQQGWTPDTNDDRMHAADRVRRALDADPRCGLALVVDGLVHTNMLKRLDAGLDKYEHALRINPNDSLAWLLKGCLHAFRGEGRDAVDGTQHALALSPLDPQRYYYDSLAATAAISAGDCERAIALARRSLRANRTHTSTHRVLTVALVLSGRIDDARHAARELLELQPELTVSRWRERTPAEGYAICDTWARALKEAGVPE